MARIYLNQEREEYLINQIEQIFADTEPNFNKRIQNFKDFEKMYRGEIYPSQATSTAGKVFPWSGRHEWNFSLFPTIVDHWESRISQAIFSLSPLFLVLPATYQVTPEDMESARKIQTFLDLYFHRIRLREKLEKLIFNTLLYGVGWLKIAWRPASENIEEEFGKAIPLTIEPTVVAPNPSSIIPVPTDVSSQDAIWCYIHKEDLKFHQIVERFKVGKYRPERIKQLQEWKGVSAYTSEIEGTEITTKAYPIYEFLLRDEENKKIVIDYFRDARMILDVVDYPFENLDCPYILFNFMPAPSTIWGISLIDRFYDLIAAVETTANQLANALDLLIVPPLIVVGGSSLSAKDIIIAPKSVIPATSPQDITPLNLPIPEAISSATNLFNLYYQQLQRVSGMSDIRMGLPKGISATETMQTLSEGGALFQLAVMNFLERLSLLPERILDVMQQYVNEPLTITGTRGEETISVSITPEDLNKEYAFYTQGLPYAPTTDKQREQVMLAYQLCIQNPLIAQDPVKIYYLLDDVLKTIGFKNVKLILGEPPTRVPQPEQSIPPQPETAEQAAMPQAGGMDLSSLLQQLSSAGGGITPMQGGEQSAGTEEPETEGGEEEEVFG